MDITQIYKGLNPRVFIQTKPGNCALIRNLHLAVRSVSSRMLISACTFSTVLLVLSTNQYFNI